MTSVEEKQVDKNSPTVILDINTVKSYNLDTGQEEFVNRIQTCGYCPEFLHGYCPDKELGVSPRYHCNGSKKIKKLLEDS